MPASIVDDNNLEGKLRLAPYNAPGGGLEAITMPAVLFCGVVHFYIPS